MIGRRAPLLVLVLAAGCTDARLYGDRAQNPKDKVTIEGAVCTDDPTERAFPVRVLFLVDTSISDGDYIAQRGDSIERLVRSYPGANYTYSVIRYAGPLRGTSCGLRNLTPDGFVKNVEDAVVGVRCADASNPGRDVMNTLSLAEAFVTGDILKTPLGLRSRTKYVVILLANGPPTQQIAAEWCNSRNPRIPDDECQGRYFEQFCGDVQPPPESCPRYQYTRIVRGLRDFAKDNGVQEFFFHVVYQRDPDDASRDRDNPSAVDFYADLALHGGGALYRSPGPAVCAVEQGDSAGCLFGNVNVDSTEAVFQRRQLIAANKNVLATNRGFKVDTDGDGLSDEDEEARGTSVGLSDTDGDYLNDRLEVLLGAVGLDPLRHDRDDPAGAWPVECPLPGGTNPNGFPPEQDLDGDGLTDCEEALLKTNNTLFDTDADGIPDPLEFRYGTNPIDADGQADSDNDGFTNLTEYRYHFDPLSKDPRADDAYRYEFRNEERRFVVGFTQPYQVTGVQILEATPDSRDGRATLFYEPPPDPTQPLSATNAARLAWRDPQDRTPSGPDPGRGPTVEIVGDGVYRLESAESDPSGVGPTFAVTVDVIGQILPRDPTRTDVRLRTTERFCFDFSIKNIQLGDTRPAIDTGIAGGNFVELFLSEVPTNNPTSYGVFRVATIPAYLDPDPAQRTPIPTIYLSDQDFFLYGE